MSPESVFRPARFIALLTGLAVASAIGCAEKTPEELLADATQELAKATQNRDAAKGSLDQLDKRLSDAQAARDTAFEAYQEALGRWEEANEAVGEFATDEVLHHQLNQALLDEAGLKSSTVQARVNLRVATLVGTASSQEAIDKAIEIAEAVPGVARVVSQIDLGPARRPEQEGVAAPPAPAETEEAPIPEPASEPEPATAAEPEELVVEVEEPVNAAADESAKAAEEAANELPELDIPEITVPEGEWHPEADVLPEAEEEDRSSIERQI